MVSNQGSKKGIRDFCLAEGVNYQYFYKKCSLPTIYESVAETLEKKQEERLKTLEKKLKEQGKKEAFDVTKLYDVCITALMRALTYLNNNSTYYKNSGDIDRSITGYMKIILELRDRGLVPTSIGENPYKEVVERINTFIEHSKKNNNTENDKDINNNIVNDNDNRETPTV